MSIREEQYIKISEIAGHHKAQRVLYRAAILETPMAVSEYWDNEVELAYWYLHTRTQLLNERDAWRRPSDNKVTQAVRRKWLDIETRWELAYAKNERYLSY